MTEKEAIEIINKNLCQGNLILALDVAKSSIMELQQYRTIGTIEECREARKRQKIEEDADPVRQMVSIPSTDEAFKSALSRATTPQIHEALKRMEGENGKRARISACMEELRKLIKEQGKTLSAYKAIQNYCNIRETCDGCLFEMEDGTPGACIMQCKGISAE